MNVYSTQLSCYLDQLFVYSFSGIVIIKQINFFLTLEDEDDYGMKVGKVIHMELIKTE